MHPRNVQIHFASKRYSHSKKKNFIRLNILWKDNNNCKCLGAILNNCLKTYN